MRRNAGFDKLSLFCVAGVGAEPGSRAGIFHSALL